MATSVTSYVDVMDDRNAPSPKYFTAPNTQQALWAIRSYNRSVEVNFGQNSQLGYSYPWRIETSVTGATFNQPIKMSESETNAVALLGNISMTDTGTVSHINPYVNVNFNTIYIYPCVVFNSEVIMSQNVTNCTQMFCQCASYNRRINIPSKVKNCVSMFDDCWEYNQPTVIPNNVENCSFMFNGCVKYNQPTVIPDSVINCCSMFQYCHSMNAEVILGNNVKDCGYMFYSDPYGKRCKMYVNNFYIPKSVTNAACMFYGCSGRPANIYINNGGYNMNFYQMLTNTQNNRRTNFYCSNIARLQSVNWFGGGALSWASMVNGYYNASSNIYLYQNYSG